MSKYEYISLRDCPHEFIITIGRSVKLDRVWWEKLIHPVISRKTDLELFFDLDMKKWKKMNDAGISLTYITHFDDLNLSMEDLAVALQQQPSKSQARKNGWSGSIPDGYSEFKRKFHRFYILKLPISTK